MSTETVDTSTAAGKVYAAGALLMMAGSLMVLAFIIFVALVAAGVIS